MGSRGSNPPYHPGRFVIDLCIGYVTSGSDLGCDALRIGYVTSGPDRGCAAARGGKQTRRMGS